MKFHLFAATLAWATHAIAVPSMSKKLEKRSPSGSFSLVAYGVAESGVNVFYSDGLAYVGDASKWEGSVTTDITFIFTDTRLYATATNMNVTLDDDTTFYIRPTPNQILTVGFTGNGIETPSDAVVDDFLFYGRYIMWQDESGVLSDSFRVKETNVTDIYQLYWDTSNLYPSGFVSPVVKSSV
ncbi:hypothetical protein PENANT_c005G11070 [Penicillium antarcticum]|uniref:Uncharacterized protein n=1 Tax=Penicillium antarcticum TaxID=416450 RepID=A0A1V6QF21_9EURO|nr:uncharacterized protein N7508_007578 [Penicillium antarcticum]KAJ5297329.1 hypothetical protein N7508_007578 [Penicillium antarcticum]OQD87818.1 hypothetical protein PENANT_c005G11070 [Penicillium antarcticum]